MFSSFWVQKQQHLRWQQENIESLLLEELALESDLAHPLPRQFENIVSSLAPLPSALLLKGVANEGKALRAEPLASPEAIEETTKKKMMMMMMISHLPLQPSLQLHW